MTCFHYVICSTSVIDKAIQWCTWLRACVKPKVGHHFEHLLYSSADFRRDLTGSFQSHSQISEEDDRIVHFCG